MFLLKHVQELLATGSLKVEIIRNFYHDVLLENAIHSLLPPPLENTQKDYYHSYHHYHYVEEFLANTIYMLELGMETEARTHLEVVEYILLKAPDQNQHLSSGQQHKTARRRIKLPS